MSSQSAQHTAGDGLAREPKSYDDLVRRTAHYAHERLAGRSFINRPTQLAIALADDGLKAATAVGTPAFLLRAIPALPEMVARARYVRTIADPQHRIGIRRLHVLAATNDVDGRPIGVLLIVRENLHSQCFLDRMLELHAVKSHRDIGGGVPDASPPSAAPETDAPPDLDIFVGGMRDEENRNVKSYLDRFQPDHRRDTRYFDWQNTDGILGAIRAAPPGTRVNVIGHSYGAHSAAFAIGMMAPTGIRVDKLITIDPVGRQPISDALRGAVRTWINVASAPDSPPDDSDRIATAGGRGGQFPSDQADLNYRVDAHHKQFGSMMTAVGPAGVSPEQILLNGGLPQQLNPRLNENFGGA